METALLETTAAWELDGPPPGETRAIMGAVAETFWERLLLVCIDLKTGDLVCEEVAEERRYVTWKACGEERGKALSRSIRSLVSDRATAWMQLTEQGWECRSRPALFPVIHALVKG